MFNTSYIKFTLHVYELKFISGGGGDGDGELLVNFICAKRVSTYLWLITLSLVIGSHRACECWMNSIPQFHHYFLCPPTGHPFNVIVIGCSVEFLNAVQVLLIFNFLNVSVLFSLCYSE